MSSSEAPKKYPTVFNKSYSDEYTCIKSSRKGNSYAFCTACNCDFSILHRGKGDIIRHLDTKKHIDNAKVIISNKKIDFMQKNDLNNIINAEALFTAFIVEHNLPISSADHAGPLFRKMFPDSSIAKKYGCARTKTTSIIGEMSKTEKKCILEIIRNNPFSIATDGSNKSDAKLYPIVVTFHNEESQQNETSLLSVPVLEGDSTGLNIAELILDVLISNDVPLENCLAFGADNAPVMMGTTAGVAGILSKKIPHLCVMGCSCHLLNLAAEKGAACLPVSIEEYLIDIYYYLEKSAKRKEKLKNFQMLHNAECRKILKHVSTRWLSLSRCLKRLLEQWHPLVSLFKEEVKNNLFSNQLKDYKIPKIKNQSLLSQPDSSNTEIKDHSDTSSQLGSSNIKIKKLSIPSKPGSSKEKINQSFPSQPVISKSEMLSSKKRKMDCKRIQSVKIQKVNFDSVKNHKEVLSREERLFLFLSSDLNKAFAQFLLHTLPLFEEPNVTLQSNSPKIHVLRKILCETLKNILARFVVPTAVKSVSLLNVKYHQMVNQKIDSDLVIGQCATKIVETLSPSDKVVFYSSVRKYFTTVCDYMLHKFPLNNEILIKSEVADVDNFEKASFSDVKYFVEKFPALIKIFGYDNFDSLVDILQTQFCSLQLEDLPDDIKNEKRIDVKWGRINRYTNKKYEVLCKVMLSILTIPHSNAECERIFSFVTKTHTKFRSSLSNETIENLLIIKSQMKTPCFQQNFDASFLRRAKASTAQILKE